jgi:hypothetical protein
LSSLSHADNASAETKNGLTVLRDMAGGPATVLREHREDLVSKQFDIRL